MSGRPTYGTEALGRIEGLGEKAIGTFLREVRSDLLKVATRQLPPLPGFRPGGSASVERQIKALAHKIATHRSSKGFAHSIEEIALHALWRAWAQSHISNQTVVNDLMGGLGHDDEGDEERAERMRTALGALVSAGATSRETLERFITFSPFARIEEFLALVRGARTAVEIERDSTLRELPDRLHKDEARLQSLETRLDVSEHSAGLMRTEMETVRVSMRELRTAIAQDHAVFAELKQALGASSETQASSGRTIAAIKQAVDAISARLAASERQMAAADQGRAVLAETVAHLGASLDLSVDGLSKANARTDRLGEDIAADAVRLKTIGSQVDALTPLAQRLEQVETMLLELADRAPVSPAPPATNIPHQSSEVVPVERLTVDSSVAVKRLGGAAEVLASLDAALVEAGVKKSTAAAFSEEVLAAVTTEQVVFLRGSFAVDIGRRCALSLCGPNVHRVAIPLGLTDPSPLRQSLNSRAAANGGAVTAIVIEGVNNSPLDILRDVLLDQATLRIGTEGRDAPTIVFASLAEGDGAFPVDSSYLELGPVFDLELMDWRRLRRENLPVLGLVARETWQLIASIGEGKSIDYEEPLRGLRRFARRRNARIEANVIRAVSALTSLRRAQSGLTTLQSVTFGWLVPYWEVLAAKPDDIDAEIDGGKCDNKTADERLSNLLAAYRGGPAAGDT